MPIPQPKDNEKQADYMGRCMHKVNKDNPKMENKQQVAICLNTYSNPKKKSKAADMNSIEVDFSDKIKEIKEKKAQIEADKQLKTENIVEEKKEELAPVAEVNNIDPIAPSPEIKAEIKIEEATASCGKPNCGSVQEVKTELIRLNDILDKVQDSDLSNIKDEILGTLNQLKYLLTLV
jgi:hypothetical protein